MKKVIHPILAALALTGCVGGVSPQLSESHPANPQAPQAPEVIPASTLMAGSQGLVLPVSTDEMDMKHEHHQAAPSAKPAQKPTDHKHEQPKKEEKK